MAKIYITKDFRSYDLPSKVPEFLVWLEAQIEAAGVPRDKVCISLSTCGYYEDTSATLELCFEREETEEECFQGVARCNTVRWFSHERSINSSEIELAGCLWRMKEEFGDG